MDGKLDPSFNTGAELRKLLRDPRQLEVHRRKVNTHATGPMGLFTRAFLIVGVTIVAVIGLYVIISKTFPQTAEFNDTSAWIWLAVSLGTVAGCLFILIKLRNLLTDTGGRSAAKPPSTYANTEPMPKDCGTEDDWRDMNGVGWSFFAPLIAGAILSRVLIGQLEPGRGALAELLTDLGVVEQWMQLLIGFGGLTLLLYAMHRVLRRNARDE
jgi:hypothetical protein